MNIGDIIQITDIQESFAQEVINVYFYQVGNASGSLPLYEQVAEYFRDNFISQLLPVQTASLKHTQVKVDNVTNGLDFYSLPCNELGTVTGDAGQTFTAYSFKLHRGTKLTRNGFKRIGGVPETYVVGNSIVSSAYTLLDTVAAVMEGTLSDSNVGVPYSFNLFPVIVGRTTTGALDLTRVQPVTQVSYDLRVTSQVSRKIRLA